MSKLKKENINSVLALCIIIGSYAIQHILPYAVTASRNAMLIEAMLFTVLTAITYFLIASSKNVELGIIASLFAFKIMPPTIGALEQYSEWGAILYFVVSKVAIVIFLVSIVKLYYSQAEPREIKPMPIVLILVAIPFFNNINSTLSAFAESHGNGNMIYSYFVSYACYAATMLLFFVIAAKSNNKTASLIINYSLLSASIKAISKSCAIILYHVNGWHISRSMILWIAIYAFFIFSFIALKNKKIKE